jgi:hypothetical protein
MQGIRRRRRCGSTRKSAQHTQAKNTRKNTSAAQSAKKVKTKLKAKHEVTGGKQKMEKKEGLSRRDSRGMWMLGAACRN